MAKKKKDETKSDKTKQEKAVNTSNTQHPNDKSKGKAVDEKSSRSDVEIIKEKPSSAPRIQNPQNKEADIKRKKETASTLQRQRLNDKGKEADNNSSGSDVEIIKEKPSSSPSFHHKRRKDSDIKKIPADKKFIAFLAKWVEKTMITCRLKTFGDDCCDNPIHIWRRDKLISTPLGKLIGEEIIDALNQITLSSGQQAIINHVLQTDIKHNRKLRSAMKKSVGIISKHRSINMTYFSVKQSRGLCAIYVNALNLNEIDKYGHCISLYRGSKTGRFKKIQLAFFELLLSLASPAQLKTLEAERSSGNNPSLRTLRQTHGFFSNSREKNTGRYKIYADHLNRLLSGSEPDSVDDKSSRPST